MSSIELVNFASDHQSQFPSFSKATKVILNENSFALPNSAYKLKEKVDDLKNLKQVLTEAQKHPRKDKIIAILASALAVSVIAALILGFPPLFNFNPFLATFGVMPASVIGGVLLGAIYAEKWGDPKRPMLLSDTSVEGLGSLVFLVLFVLTPFIPIYHTFGKVTRYKNAITKEEAEIQEINENNEKFFMDNDARVRELIEKLKSEIQNFYNDLGKVEGLSTRLPEIENKLRTKIQNLETARAELDKARSYFSPSEKKS